MRAIVVACPPGHAHDLAGDDLAVSDGGDLAVSDGDDLAVVDGGETRAASVANALAVVETELVAIHDAARPLVTPALIEAVVAALAADPDADGAIAAAPVTDTIKRVGESRTALSTLSGQNADLDVSGTVDRVVISETVDRGTLWRAQTPQAFRTDALRRALAADPAAAAAATDEAMLIEAAGGRVLIHPAPPENLKVTVPHDLRFAELLLSERARESAEGR